MLDQKLPLYPIFIGLASGTGIEVSRYFFNKYEQKNFWRKCIVLLLMSWIGAKSLFILTSNQNINFLSGGGFVFYGGLIGGLVGCLLLRLKTFEINLLIPGLEIAHAIGRLGCFVVGCCHGKICPLPQIDHYPTQLFEAIFLLVLGSFYFKQAYEFKIKEKRIWLDYLFLYAVFRFFNEFLRGDLIRGMQFGLSTSQWISIALVLFVIVKKLFR